MKYLAESETKSLETILLHTIELINFINEIIIYYNLH